MICDERRNLHVAPLKIIKKWDFEVRNIHLIVRLKYENSLFPLLNYFLLIKTKILKKTSIHFNIANKCLKF